MVGAADVAPVRNASGENGPYLPLGQAIDRDTGASHKSGHPRQIHQFEVQGGSALSARSVFCDLGDAMPDGFRVDELGNVWSSAGWAGPEQDGVQIFAPDGDKIGAIHLPEGVSNLCFGGLKRNRLFMTGGQSIYSLYVEVQGMPYM